jgi:hypothetical protein
MIYRTPERRFTAGTKRATHPLSPQMTTDQTHTAIASESRTHE